jgi:hypothetical protein
MYAQSLVVCMLSANVEQPTAGMLRRRYRRPGNRLLAGHRPRR